MSSDLEDVAKALEKFQRESVEMGDKAFMLLKEVYDLSPIQCFGALKAAMRIFQHHVGDEEFKKFIENTEHTFPESVIDSLLRGEQIAVITTDDRTMSGILTGVIPKGEKAGG